MPEKLVTTDLADDFTAYIDRVEHSGESFILIRDGVAIAELRPILKGRKLSELPIIFASLPHLSLEEAEDFAKDIEEARASLKRENVNHWAD